MIELLLTWGKLFSRKSRCGCVHTFIEHGLVHSIQVLFFLPLSSFIAIEIMDTVIFLVLVGKVLIIFLNC